MKSFAGQKELWLVALRADAVEFRHGFFAQKEWIDVGAAGEDDAVEPVEQGKERFTPVVWRYDYGGAACLEHGEIVSPCQFATLVAEVACNANERSYHLII